MGLYSLVTLDLNFTNETQRARFYESLRAQGWEKHAKLTTVWTITWAPGGTPTGATETIDLHLKTAANVAGVTKYDVCVMHSTAPVIEWTVAPRPANYLGYGSR